MNADKRQYIGNNSEVATLENAFTWGNKLQQHTVNTWSKIESSTVARSQQTEVDIHSRAND